MWYLQRVNTLLFCRWVAYGGRANVLQHHLLLALSTPVAPHPFRGMPSRIASTTCSAGRVSRSRRLTRVRARPSASAISPADLSSILQEPPPPIRPDERADQRPVRPRLRRRPRVAAVRRDDHFAAAAAFPDAMGRAPGLASWRSLLSSEEPPMLYQAATGRSTAEWNADETLTVVVEMSLAD